jgi:hypothetical protein
MLLCESIAVRVSEAVFMSTFGNVDINTANRLYFSLSTNQTWIWVEFSHGFGLGWVELSWVQTFRKIMGWVGLGKTKTL